ncbi:MAG TPA: SLC13 family permease, partial [Bryobacteraceae bacterium]|nr:SLC13 family permease [Bryobacteraceae bacterium]
MNDSLLWTIALGTVAGMLFGPRALPEYVWAGIGAILLVLLGFVPLSSAGPAIWKGMDVYLFLVGMMLLAELARREGVFDWLAAIAVNSSKGSRTRLFTLVY